MRRAGSRYWWILSLVVAVVLGTMGWTGTLRDLYLRRPRSAHRPARIVVVTLDTMHVDFLGAYNPSVDFTPNLDELARHGIRFARAYAPVPLTLPSHSSLFTGLSPLTHGVMLNGDRLADARTTLAEILSQEGYRTAAFVSLGVLKPAFGLDQGFENYDAEFDKRQGLSHQTADEIVGKTMRWVEANKNQEFFLWVHLSDTHAPYAAVDAPPNAELRLDGTVLGSWNLTRKEMNRVTFKLPPGTHTLEWLSLRPPEQEGDSGPVLRLTFLRSAALEALATQPVPTSEEEMALDPSYSLTLENRSAQPTTVRLAFRGRLAKASRDEILEQYRLEVAYVDRHFGRLRQFFRDLELDEETLWFVVSDHGEGLFRHGEILGHAKFAFEDQLRIAWVMTGRGLPRGLVVSDVAVRTEDVLPTLLAHLRLDGYSPADGVSRKACWSWRGCPPTEPWWAYAADGTGVLRAVAGYAWPYKMLWRSQWMERQPPPGRYLFNLDEDPGESFDLLGSGSDELPALVVLDGGLERRRRTFEKALAERPVEASEEHLEMLKSLGYL